MDKIAEMRQNIESLTVEVRSLIASKKVDEAKTKMEELRQANESLKIEEELAENEKRELENQNKNEERGNVNMEKTSAMELRAIIKASMGKQITEEERALLVGGTNGEGYILPQDIRTKINTLIRQYRSLRDVVGYMPTTALSGSFPVENFETVTELIDFTDGTDGTEADDIKFKNVPFALKEKGALIKLSNTLLNMTDNDLINYVAQIFAKKAVITENKMAVAALKLGKTIKQIADWKALKKSINVDLDEAVKYGLCICVNQDGFDVLDSALDSFGRPVLQPDPSQPTRKLFMGYPVEVYSNMLLPTVATKAPIFYGNCSEAVKFVDNGKYSFATSSEAGFKANATFARVIEYIDVVKVDSSDKIYIAGELTIA